MHLHVKPRVIRMGTSTIHEVCRVTGLDVCTSQAEKSQLRTESTSPPLGNAERVAFSNGELQKIEQQLAIVVPCMNEPQAVLEGVLYGVPHCCLIIVVSNSTQTNFETEQCTLEAFCTDTQRSGIIIHQKDKALARAFHHAGLKSLLKENGAQDQLEVRNGKGEAMMIGITIARLTHKRFVGFIDADNFVPGAVYEYCRVFAAGFCLGLEQRIARHSYRLPTSDLEMSPDPDVMVRIQWNSKPKIEEGKLVAKNFGRCSHVVNAWMNRFLSALSGTGAEEDMIQTANAGEHAMSINLAMELRFATGYAVEPYELIDIWERSFSRGALKNTELSLATDEQSSATSPRRRSEVLRERPDVGLQPRDSTFRNSTSDLLFPSALEFRDPIRPSRETHIFQVRTRNPHIHDFLKGETHIKHMQIQGLRAMYQSPLCPQDLKEELRFFVGQELSASIDDNAEVEPFRVYPPIGSMNFEIFLAVLQAHPQSLRFVGSGAGLTFGN